MEYSSGNPILKESGEPVSQGINSRSTPPPSSKVYYLDLSLRFLLMASSLVATVVMRTGKQTKLITNPVTGLVVSQQAISSVSISIWKQSPAFIYFVSALSLATSYGGTTALNMIYQRRKCGLSNEFLFYVALFDALTFGIVASATGAAGAVAYIGLKGNKYVGWVKVCSVYDRFCTYMGTSVAFGLFSSILLLLIVMLNTYNAHRQIRSR